MLGIDGQAGSPAEATRIAARVSGTSIAYMQQMQTKARIRQGQRVQLALLPASKKPALIHGHWRESPLVALSLVMGLLLLAASIKFAEERRGSGRGASTGQAQSAG